MDYLNWDLEVLSKAVNYSNLSGASRHVGLSQPQLSRIIAKLEDQFDVSLLDRDAKRKSSWTPAAFRLAEIYSRTLRSFNGEVMQLLDSSQVRHLRIGTLEGMVGLSLRFGHQVFKKSSVDVQELHVYDLSELEERFFRGELDCIFSSREPGRKKYKYSKVLGYQTLDKVTGKTRGKTEYTVLSSFQNQPNAKHPKGDSNHRSLISNSLFVREMWINTYGGTATIPSDVRQARSGRKNEEPVLMLLQDHFSKSFWDEINEF